MKKRKKPMKFDEYHEPSWTPSEEELKECTFKKSKIEDVWTCVGYNYDVAGVNMPCMITYHSDANYFLVGGNFFSPKSKESLKVVIESFSVGPNRKITDEINRREFPYLYK